MSLACRRALVIAERNCRSLQDSLHSLSFEPMLKKQGSYN